MEEKENRIEDHREKNFQQRILFVLCFILVCMILWSAAGILAEEETSDVIPISVIVENNSSSKWVPFILGLEHAAKDYEVDLDIVTTGRFASIKEQWDLISQKIENGAKGILMSPVEADFITDLNGVLSTDVKLAFVESDMNRSEDFHRGILSVKPNEKEMAQEIVDAIKADYGIDLPGKKVKVLITTPKQQRSIVCLSYLKEALEEEGCIFLHTENTSFREDIRYLRNNQIDLCIALDDESLTIAANEVAKQDKIRLYGIGTNETNVYYLDQGIISCMIVPNDFQMGYEALAGLAEQIRNNETVERTIEVGMKVVRPEEVHGTEMEQYLYPNKR